MKKKKKKKNKKALFKRKFSTFCLTELEKNSKKKMRQT